MLSEAKVSVFTARLRPTVFTQRQLALGSLDHTVYFRNKPHELPQLKRTFSLVSYSVIIVFFTFKQGISKDAMVTVAVF